MFEEQWKEIPEWPDYMASNLGHLYSKKKRKVMIQHQCHPFGYLGITLCRNGKRIHKMVHPLIISSFIGPRPEGLEINHKDSNPKNNNIENLEYVTHGQNMKHGYDVGNKIRPKGELHPMTSLTDKTVIFVRSLKTKGLKNIDIHKLTGIEASTISRLVNHKIWNHI